MQLILHELIHLTFSLIVGFLVWRIYKKPVPAFIAAILGGVLIDADHLIDYFLVFGLNFKPSYFFNSYQFVVSNKVYVLFHAWEYLAILFLMILFIKEKVSLKNRGLKKALLSFLVALTLGTFSHLLVDTVTNNVVLLGYSIIYRAANGFQDSKISKNIHPPISPQVLNEMESVN